MGSFFLVGALTCCLGVLIGEVCWLLFKDGRIKGLMAVTWGHPVGAGARGPGRFNYRRPHLNHCLVHGT